jgi:hypothetical protein
MKRILFLPLYILSFSSCDTIMKTADALGNGTVTEQEAGDGIRQALSKGVDAGISLLNKQDGFFGNQAYKLFLPADAQKIENTLRDIGFGKQVDKAILQINRSAENAVGHSRMR